MAKIKEVDYGDGKRLEILCPGCGWSHSIDPAKHTWNGDIELPTLTPSLLCDWSKRCHSFVKEGKIQFLNDCHHNLKGQTVDLPDIE